MKLSIAVASLVVLVGCAHAPAYDRDAVAREASALVEEWSRTGREGRWQDLKALYADDPGFAWVERGVVAYDSHAAIVAGVEQAARANLKVDTRVRDVVAVPLAADAAAVRAGFSMRIEFSPTQTIEQQGTFTGVAVKRAGRWQFLQGSMASAEPRPAGR
jgi:hypothetical protein